jgi:ribosome maturation factor RimP
MYLVCKPGPVWAFFVLGGQGMYSERLKRLVEPVVEALGYELVLLEYMSGNALLRIYLDSPGGITLEDCERVSREVSGMLEVEDPIQGAYRLEVSSPGLDRPLVKPAHFERFVGQDVRISLSAPRLGRRRYSGRLLSYADGKITVNTTDQGEQSFALSEIEHANLLPHFDN